MNNDELDERFRQAAALLHITNGQLFRALRFSLTSQLNHAAGLAKHGDEEKLHAINIGRIAYLRDLVAAGARVCADGREQPDIEDAQQLG